MALALERKIAGIEDAPAPTPDHDANTNLGGASELGSSFVASQKEGGREACVVEGSTVAAAVAAAGAGALEKDLGGEGEGTGEGVKKGGSRRRLLYCGVAALGVGLVGAAVWALGGRPPRR